MEELDKIDVSGVVLEVLLEQSIDGGLKHEGIVDGNHANTLLTIPARLTTASDAGVHDVVRDEEECLEELGHPAKGGSLKVLLFGQRLLENKGDGVGDGHATVTFSTDGVDFEGLRNTES